MLCQFWFYVFCTVCTVCWSIWNQSSPRCWNNNVLCGSVRVCARKQARTHARTCDQKIKSKKMPNTNCKQAQPSERATQVCVCALPFATPCVFAIFVRRDVRPPSLPCVCVYLCHFGRVCFSEASATICFSFPGGWFPRLPPARYSLSLPSLLQRTSPAAVLFPFVLLKLQNTNADCKIYWSKMGRDWREGRENTAATAESDSFQNAKWFYRQRQSVICFIVAQQTLELRRLRSFIYFGRHTGSPKHKLTALDIPGWLRYTWKHFGNQLPVMWVQLFTRKIKR